MTPIGIGRVWQALGRAVFDLGAAGGATPRHDARTYADLAGASVGKTLSERP